ncbi:MAG: hypothetical protein D6720_10820 [Gammaproteobacteria bacterium]|nr:MAG: hypothetical protein D6720_10820 [Gammaproteobacteria bacterium]
MDIPPSRILKNAWPGGMAGQRQAGACNLGRVKIPSPALYYHAGTIEFSDVLIDGAYAEVFVSLMVFITSIGRSLAKAAKVWVVVDRLALHDDVDSAPGGTTT